MKLSLKWLNDYVDVKDFFSKPSELDALLTRAGLEVENFINQKEQFNNVVIGYIQKLEKHPDADRLTVCQVEIAPGKIQQIVCGAKNHKQGDLVVAALPGAVLPGNFEIKKSKIRGQESLGMLCSEKELGLAESSEGIYILSEKVAVGEEFSQYAGLDDIVFEISVTPNRADCLSHIGLARELSCLLDRPIKLPSVDIKKTSKKSTFDQMKLEVRNTDLCPRYAGRSILNVKVGPSPKWLKQRLEAVELNSINNVVDVTNYILMELGQPLHAFDAKTIDGRMIIVGNAQKGEEFTTLDGSQIKLSDEELMIRDQKKSVALAGVMGGENSGVSESTTELFIESAYFLPESVRRASRKFGIESDSSYRFSRGIDPEGVEYALQRACALIQQVAGGEVCADHYDEYPQPIQREPIYISKDFIEQKLGYGVDSSSFEDWMKRLGCHILGDAARWEVTPPKYRWDLFYDVDLIEEYARLNGYENIPETTPLMNYQPTAHFDFYDKSRVLISSAVTQGFYQAMNYHFVSSHWQSEFLGDSSKLSGNGVLTASEGITLKNPLNEDLDVMRTSLLPGLFKNILHNSRHNMSKGALFEQGVVFEKKESFVEHHRLSLALWGSSRELWQKDETPAVLRLKSALENILRRLGCQKWQWRKVEGHLTPDFLHLGQFAQLFLEGKPVGYVGSLHPAYKAKYKLREDVALGDFDSEALLKNYPRKFKFSPLSKFPAVERDLAFLLPHQMEAGEVIKVIEKVSPLVQSVAVFDVFSGSGVADGMSSVAFKIKIQDDTKTLEEDFLTGLQKQIIAEVERRLSVKVRGE